MAERGFDGTVMEPGEEFTSWLGKKKPPAWMKGLVLHCTSAPNLAQVRATTSSSDPKVDAMQRDKNFWGHVSKNLAGKGWHFTTFEGGWIGNGCDPTVQGAHANTFNTSRLGWEMAMDGDSNDPLTEAGKQIIEITAWGFSRVLKWAGLPANADTIKYHNEEPKAKSRGKTCPGKNMLPKAEFIKKVQAYLDGDKPIDLPPEGRPPVMGNVQPKADWTTKELQEILTRLGYDPGPIDDIWGPKTEAAYKALQRFLGVLDTGKPGPWVVNKARTLKPPPAKPEAPKALPVVEDESTGKSGVEILVNEAGWPAHWAKGAMGNSMQEAYADIRHEAQGDKIGGEYTAFGAMQWRNERKANLDAFAAARGKTWQDWKSQVLFIPHELKTSEKLAWKWLQKAENVEQATAAMVLYERPAGYISSKAKAADTWDELMAVAHKCDGWSNRLKYALSL